MKVYALREMTEEHSWMPVRGYHGSVAAAKKQAKELFKRTDMWDIFAYEMQGELTKEDLIALLNGDSLSSTIWGKVPREFLLQSDIGIVFENAAMKRYRKEQK